MCFVLILPIFINNRNPWLHQDQILNVIFLRLHLKYLCEIEDFVLFFSVLNFWTLIMNMCGTCRSIDDIVIVISVS